jgi:hypothetical protein
MRNNHPTVPERGFNIVLSLWVCYIVWDGPNRLKDSPGTIDPKFIQLGLLYIKHIFKKQ